MPLTRKRSRVLLQEEGRTPPPPGKRGRETDRQTGRQTVASNACLFEPLTFPTHTLPPSLSFSRFHYHRLHGGIVVKVRGHHGHIIAGKVASPRYETSNCNCARSFVCLQNLIPCQHLIMGFSLKLYESHMHGTH